MAKLTMSNVEFQRVDTSRGIMRGLRERVSRTSYHFGRTMVEEFLIAKDTPRSCSKASKNVEQFILSRSDLPSSK